MSGAAGMVIAAAGVEAVNEMLSGEFNWHILPAAAVMAVALTGVDKLAPGFGTGLSMLVFLSVLVIPYGNAPTPLQNLGRMLGYMGGAPTPLPSEAQ
jgi:hypothetical protein